MTKLNLTGQRFSRLVALEDTGERQHRKVMWLCICDCGNLIKKSSNKLRSGRVQSCGCLGKEKAADQWGERNPNYRHGYSNGGNRLYGIRRGMIQRCENSNSLGYKYYGKKGIKIYSKWRNNFLLFRGWALKNGYKDDLVLDRIDNGGNYVPKNCQWLTRSAHATKSGHERSQTSRVMRREGEFFRHCL